MGNLLNLAIYNPALLTDDDFIASFVAREKTVKQLLKRLGEITLTNLAQHNLLIGQRGMGKTSLLRRLALGVTEDPTLNNVLLPLTFREEQYNVHNLQVFWCNCLDALGDWFEKNRQTEKVNEIDNDVAKLSREKNALDGISALEVFKSWVKQEGKRPILFLDNIDIVLNGLKKQQWDLRRISQESGGIVIMGASTFYMEPMADKEAAFYDFFQVTVLEKLSHKDLMTCLRRLAKVRGPEGRNVVTIIDQDPGRIRTLYDLTGGNPRTLMLLYLLLEMDGGGNVFSDLERLLDQVTVLYKARVEDLPAQARVVLDALALAWDPIHAAGIATTSGLATATVSTHLDRMSKDGLVEKATLSSTARTAFQLSERFFNIWYLMRHAPRRQRTRLRWLTGFLRSFYTPKQLTDRAKEFLRLKDHQGLERREYYLALSEAIDDPGWRNLLGFEAVTEFERYAADDGGEVEADFHLSEVHTPETAKDWLVQGRLLSRHLERYKEAEDAYRKAIELDPKRAAPWGGLGNLLQDHLERYEEAEDAYRKAIELDPMRAGPRGALGDLLQDHLERYEEAEDAYRKAIELDPKWAAPWGRLGNLLHYRLERYEEAEDAYRKTIEVDPKGAAPWMALGDLLQNQLERYEEAEDAYRKAIELDPKQANRWTALGDLLENRLERYEEAEDAYRKASELEDSIRTLRLLGDLLLNRLDRVDEAMEAYSRAITIKPTNRVDWEELGYLLFFLFDKRNEAIHAYEQALTFAPNNLAYRSNLLVLHLLDAKKSNAIDEEFEAVVVEHSASGAALLEALRAMARENFGEASSAFQRAIVANDPEIFETYRGYFVLFLRLATSRGYGDKLLCFFEDQGFSERYWPIYAALDAYVHGEERLMDVNPEVRGVATPIYTWLDNARKAMSQLAS